MQLQPEQTEQFAGYKSLDARRRYLMMALGSVDEVKLWCCYARDLGYAEAVQADTWQAAYVEVARMLQGLLRRLSEN